MICALSYFGLLWHLLQLFVDMYPNLFINISLKRINLRKTRFMQLFNLKPISKQKFFELFEGPSKRTIRRRIKKAELDAELPATKRHYYWPSEYFKIIIAMDEDFTPIVEANRDLFYGT